MSKFNTPMYTWLGVNGFLEDHITPEQLTQGKKMYKRIYNREYQRKRRKEFPVVRVTLSKEEYQRLKADAAANTDKRKQHVATSLREHALASLDNKPRMDYKNLILDLLEYHHLIHYDIRRMRDDILQSEGVDQAESYDLLLDRITALEDYTKAKLEHPEEVTE